MIPSDAALRAFQEELIAADDVAIGRFSTATLRRALAAARPALLRQAVEGLTKEAFYTLPCSCGEDPAPFDVIEARAALLRALEGQ